MVLLCKRQHGFVQKRSTVTNLLEVESYLAEWDNLKQPYDIITFDFCRAFDKGPTRHFDGCDCVLQSHSIRIRFVGFLTFCLKGPNV